MNDTMNFMQSLLSNSIQDTEVYAKQFVKAVIDSYTEGGSALVVGLSGELGSGKTTFMKGVAKAFGVTETVTSPTFVIEKIYKLKDKPFKKLIHIDAYRLEKGKELLTLGWGEIQKNPENIIFIEWPERVKEVLPKDMIPITFTVIGEHEREIKVNVNIKN